MRASEASFFSYSSLSPSPGLEWGMPVVTSRGVFKPLNIGGNDVYEHGIADDSFRAR